MSQSNQSLEHLDTLIKTCHSGKEGYTLAAKKVEDAGLRTRFLQYANERADFAQRLSLEMDRLGGTPPSDDGISGSLHRGWMSVRAAVGSTPDAIIAECERGEDAAKEAYETALQNNWPTPIDMMLRTQYGAVKAAHDHMRTLKTMA